MTKQHATSVAVIGAGVMGAQISQVLAVSGLSVSMYDLGEEQLSAGLTRIRDHRFGLAVGVQRGKMSRAEMAATLSRIRTTTDLGAALHDADIAIEAVPEDMGLKVRVFREMDRLAPEHTVLTTNTAGLPVAALAYATDRPQQVLGWHWAQPCVVMRMAELVVHEGTSEASVSIVSNTALACGKNPVVIRDQPLDWGFVANRINRAVRREATRIVEEGVATEAQVDALVKDCFNWPMGPFENQNAAFFS